MTDLTELRELAGKATKGPYFYRPDKHDDWGTVKTARDPSNPDMPGWTIARFRMPYTNDAELDQYRRNDTDPWEADARFHAAASPDVVLSLIDRLEKAEASLADAERRGIEQMRTRCTDYVYRFLLQRTGMSPKRIADLRAALATLKVEG